MTTTPPTSTTKDSQTSLETNVKPQTLPRGDGKRALPSSSDDHGKANKKRAVSLVEILQQACFQNKPKGWRAKELGFESKKGRRAEFRQAFFRDCTELKGYRSSRSRGELNHHERNNDSGKFQKRQHTDMDPLSIAYLSYSWGVGKNFCAELAKTKQKDDSVGATTLTKNKSAAAVQQEADARVQGMTVRVSSQSSGSQPPAGKGDATNVASLSQQQLTTAVTKFSDTLIRFQHAHASNCKRGWRARQKEYDIPNEATFQQEVLRDLVTLRGARSDGILDNSDNQEEGPMSLNYLSFAWGMNQDYFHNLPSLALSQAQAISVVQPDKTTTAKQALSEKKKAPKKPPPKALKDILAEGCTFCKPKGWRAQELGFSTKKGRSKEFRNAFLLDLMELRGYRSAVQSIKHSDRGTNGQFQKAKNGDTMDPFSISYLNYAWGVGRNYANAIMNPSAKKQKGRKDDTGEASTHANVRKEQGKEMLEVEECRKENEEDASVRKEEDKQMLEAEEHRKENEEDFSVRKEEDKQRLEAEEHCKENEEDVAI